MLGNHSCSTKRITRSRQISASAFTIGKKAVVEDIDSLKSIPRTSCSVRRHNGLQRALPKISRWMPMLLFDLWVIRSFVDRPDGSKEMVTACELI